MDKKYIMRALRPLKTKIYLDKALKAILSAVIASGAISLGLVIVSMFAVIPFVRYKMLAITGVGIVAAFFASLFFIPSGEQLIMTADSLGLKERIITAWYLIGDNSEIAELQRQDTRKVLESTDLASAYKITVEKHLYIPAVCIILAAFLLSFVPGRVFNETRIRESLIQQMDQYEKKIEDEIEAQKEKNPEISNEQLEQLKEALEKLKEEFNKSKSEEDALKALAQMENKMEKLMEQEPLRDLSTLEKMLSDLPLTKDLAEALEKKDEEALKEALELLEKELENGDEAKELAEMLEKAAMNMEDSSMLAEALQSLASEAGSGNMSGKDIAQSLLDLIQQAQENAEGQQGFENALEEISDALAEARRAISAVDQRVASGNTGRQGQSGSNANNGGSSQEGGKSGNGKGNTGGSQSGGQNGNGNGKGNQKGSGSNSGNGSGEGSQGEMPGSGAGEGSTGTDAGYKEGDQPGRGRAPGSGKEEEYKMIYIPTRLGGEGNESTLPGQKLESGSSIYNETAGLVKKGEMVPYNEVLSQYREEAVQTMERQDIPTGMKELVKSYFSSLD